MTTLNILNRFHLETNIVNRLPHLGAAGNPPEAGVAGETVRTQTLHRQARPGHAGNP
ncbi:hypothetical protein [Desulfomicrobium sp. ZS1]|uniref:hypothetical protein n=1 Tax=Desulfomicrobium sp. ZS1 TaxID=2952228 RepID=UPI0035315062